MRVYGYCRVSSTRQVEDGISLEEQQRRIEGRALEQGWTLNEMFVERGVSGAIPLGERPEGARLLARLRRGDVVIAAKLDRCFRSAVDCLTVIKALKDQGVSLWLLDLGGDCTGDGIAKLVLTIMSAVAEWERERITERVRDGIREARATGRWLGNPAPFGWRVADRPDGHKQIVRVPEQQAIIRDMVRLRNEGKTLDAIRIWLGETHGIFFTIPGVRKIINREKEMAGE